MTTPKIREKRIPRDTCIGHSNFASHVIKYGLEQVCQHILNSVFVRPWVFYTATEGYSQQIRLEHTKGITSIFMHKHSKGLNAICTRQMSFKDFCEYMNRGE